MNAVVRAERARLIAEAPADVPITLDGREVNARAGETLLEVAQRVGIEIPHLCWTPGLDAAGNCRACVVEVNNERTLAASCCRKAEAGMKVLTASERARRAQKLVLELLQADLPPEPRLAPETRPNEVDVWSEKLGLGAPRFAPRAQPPADRSHPAITVRLDACIQCTRCLRACRDEQDNDVIGIAWRGGASKIVFDADDPMGASTCVACGECVQACPTGALAPASLIGEAATTQPIADKRVDSVCPYCGVGCQLTYHVKDDKILFVEGRDGPANRGRLCVKGRYGFDYARHPAAADRAADPQGRRAEARRAIGPGKRPRRGRAQFPRSHLGRGAGTRRRQRCAASATHTARARWPASARPRAATRRPTSSRSSCALGFGSNNVDHCTRLCHASSVAALLEGIGSAAVSNPVIDVSKAEVVIVIGANPVVNHPVAATWIKNAVRAGTKLVVIDPRRSDLARTRRTCCSSSPTPTWRC
jgi:formate dehydrogenase major subunit